MKKPKNGFMSVYRVSVSILTFIITFTLFNTQTVSGQGPLLRFPDIHDNNVVFVYGEDIWIASEKGGVATRLTIHDGEERHPKFSPDGSSIAFTGYYDGNPDVYVMNVYGGEITRVTFHPYTDEVIGWHPVKNKIIFKSFRHSYNRFFRLFMISPDGTGLEEIILNEAAQGSFSPDGKKIAYNHVSRENRTWKRYVGGTAQEVYLYDFETNTRKNLTNYKGTDRIPMWIGDKIYFSSDRDRVLNIYSCDPESGKIEQITRHTEYDIRRPSMGGDKIVYELGGKLMVLDVTTKETKQIQVKILTDAPEVRPYLKKVDGYISGVDCSPSGERALIVARGEVFTVPAKKGPTRNLTQSSGARDKDAAWSPDGKYIAYLSDKSGEYEICLIDPFGKKDAIQLTNHKDGYRHTLRWSPNSKMIAFTDHTLTCYILNIETKKITTVDKAQFENIDVSLYNKPINDFKWSPDSRYITYSLMNKDLVYQVYIYSLDNNKVHCVSNGLYNDFNPVFSTDGNYLFFISNRRFSPTFCDFEWEMVYKNTSGIYYLTLRKDIETLLPYYCDEATVEGLDKKEGKSEKPSGEHIDFDGISGRVEALPLASGNYRNLAINDSKIYYQNKEDGDFNKFEFRAVGPMTLYSYCLKGKNESTVIENISNYKLSSDGSKIVYSKGDGVGIICSGSTDSEGGGIRLSGLKMWFNPKEEWKQIFNEAWRFERDYYYDPNMHGIDWDAMKIKYGKLIEFASCRQDVVFIIGELIGELNTSHTYVYGGDKKRTNSHNVNVGMLGADYMVDTKANRYQFKKIYRVPDWTDGIYSPLNKPGMNVKEGEYLLQVNGIDIFADKNIYSYFQDLGGKQVTLLINDKPTKEGAREIVVKPLGGEQTLRYQSWQEHNHKVVAEASDGQIGYLYFPDTYTGTAKEFPKFFYSQTNKQGLIIDGRFNGGGLDPSIFLQRLRKGPHSYWTRRHSHDQTSPAYAITAHMACLTNRQAGSGGDELPFEFQQFNMGPVIGTRTWGGLVGVSMFIEMIDGGGLTAPDYRIYMEDGRWVVENEGVQPDIVIDLHPAEMAKGYDAQLMKAVELLLKQIKENPYTWPQHDAIPVDN